VSTLEEYGKIKPFVIKPKGNAIHTLWECRKSNRPTVIIVERTVAIAIDITDITRLGRSPCPGSDATVFDFLGGVVDTVTGKAEKLTDRPAGFPQVVERPRGLIHKKDFVFRIGVIGFHPVVECVDMVAEINLHLKSAIFNRTDISWG